MIRQHILASTFLTLEDPRLIDVKTGLLSMFQNELDKEFVGCSNVVGYVQRLTHEYLSMGVYIGDVAGDNPTCGTRECHNEWTISLTVVRNTSDIQCADNGDRGRACEPLMTATIRTLENTACASNKLIQKQIKSRFAQLKRSPALRYTTCADCTACKPPTNPQGFKYPMCSYWYGKNRGQNDTRNNCVLPGADCSEAGGCQPGMCAVGNDWAT